MNDRVDLLFFAAHADDLELSCGGTIAKSAKDGLRVGLVELTRGEMGTRGTPKVRYRESQRAAKILGVEFRYQLDFGDGGLRTSRDEELELIEVIRRHTPRVIFAPWPDERHPDHVRTGRLCGDAAFYAGLRALQTSRAAHRPQVTAYYLQNYVLHPTFVVDVSAAWKTKMRAIAAFKSQFHNPGSKEAATFIADPKFLGMIEARGKHFGALIGAEYGEAYITKQPPKLDDIVGAYEGREP